MASFPRIPFLIAAILIAVVFWPAYTFTLFNDDNVYVFQNEAIQTSPLWQLLTQRMNRYEFLPLRDLTYWIDWRLFGSTLLPYHLHNLLWYFLACLAAWFAAGKLHALHAPGGARDSRPLLFPLAVLAFFLLHPIHMEPVIWVAGRKDLMAGFFIFLATGLWAQCLSLQDRKAGWLAIACYVLAVFSKTPSLVFPAIAISMWLAWGKEKTSRPQLTLIAILLLAGLAAAFVSITVGKDTDVISSSRETDLAGRILLAVRILGESVSKSVAPVNLRLLYDYLFLKFTPGWTAVDFLGVATAVAAVGAFWHYIRHRALWALGVLWAAVFMLPYLQLIPFHAFAPFSDRFAFIASFGVVLIAALLVNRPGKAVHRQLALAGLATVLAILALVRSADWYSLETLLSRESRLGVGGSSAQGEYIAEVLLPAGRYDEALAAALRISDPDSRITMQLRIENERLSRSGNPESWRGFLQQAVAVHADALTTNTAVATEIGRGCFSQGLFNEAVYLYRKMLAAQNIPAKGKGDVRYNLGLALEKTGHFAEALDLYRQAATDPARSAKARAVTWNNIGTLQAAQGVPAEAELAYKTAHELDPLYEYPVVNLANFYLRTGRTTEFNALLASPAGRLPLVVRRFSR